MFFGEKPKKSWKLVGMRRQNPDFFCIFLTFKTISNVVGFEWIPQSGGFEARGREQSDKEKELLG